jgi:hypothetical protein
MKMRLKENQYRGVNAHLQSMLQLPASDWPSFHFNHCNDIAAALNAILPSPYRAYAEKSLQIRLSGSDSQKRIPDVSVYEMRGEEREATPGRSAFATPTWQATLEETLETVIEMPAVMIYHFEDDVRSPVVRLELLSPSNKMGGGGYGTYLIKRSELIQEGLPLIEIDYLHQTGSPVLNMPAYPDDPNSYPYHFTITDPRLPSSEKPVRTYGFGVDVPFPPMPIPLLDSDVVTLDLADPYNRTFTEQMWWRDADYSVEPLDMESYRDDDQAAIRARMAAVEAAQEAMNE